MYREIKDEQIFRKFWQDERSNTPQFMQDFGDTWHCSEDDFLEFCAKMWRVYIVNDTTLVYIEPNGEVHLSVLRGSDTSNLVGDLIEMRNEVLQKLPVLWGWVGKKNRGIRKLMTDIGFHFEGFTMLKGASHGRVLEWQAYMVTQKEFFIRQNKESLLISN